MINTKDLTHVILGPLYEAKLTIDKTNGHASYGCYTCCGEDGIVMGEDPMNLPVASTQNQSAWSASSCLGHQINITGAMSTWWTDNTSIATEKSYQITGVAPGSTNNNTQGTISISGFRQCSEQPRTGVGPTNIQIPTYFGPTGYTTASGDCAAGSVGTFINVSDQVLDQNGVAEQLSGITPQEKVCVSGSCQSSYNTFSTPVSTTNAGTFNDTPIGTCFPAPTTNECVNVSVTYKAYIFGPTNSYTIETTSNRQDCVQGEKDKISSNPTIKPTRAARCHRGKL